MTALVLYDPFGGDLMPGEVRVGKSGTGVHYWNCFAAGIEIEFRRQRKAVSDPPGCARSDQGCVVVLRLSGPGELEASRELAARLDSAAARGVDPRPA